MYNFGIREIENGWLLKRTSWQDGEFFPTLNDLCNELLNYVDQAYPTHRRTGARKNKKKVEDEKE